MTNIFLNIINDYLGVIIVAIIIVLVLIIWLITRKKITKEIPVDQTFLDNLLMALGTKDNIESLNLEQQRIKIHVLDTKKIDATYFTNEKLPAFISGNKITVLFKEHAKEIYQFLSSKGA
ncbi:MAG: hypothetical protein WCR19_03540 [Acholeplasmataceae bacterium]